ncbi:uncharacterized protein PFL1_05604 [Pseudozyma flocculosa PF-1]|uniref:Uncharacterized protein n=1 Tax=Pseudozyma flocculosa PF-1 TaxID=1277687 RepID=A0A061H3Q2_9BASI|nr:uncharacterized protein PFL1_05604 [Pseudozyma flocculosa PF-1]EPQ26969.1 hypothetical protein PFL1_05604 [Pseudozyma flocculosa PF-1]
MASAANGRSPTTLNGPSSSSFQGLSHTMAAAAASAAASNTATAMPNSPASHISTASINTVAAASSLRRAFLDESALSPPEFVVYTASFASIKPAASGQPGLVDEADGLRYLRDECGLNLEDELEILSLFERTPRGLASGHFFAMLRLVSWAQQGRTATKELLFTQTSPARISHSKQRSERPALITTPQSAHAATFGSPQSFQASPAPRSQTAAPAAAIGSGTPLTSATLLKPQQQQQQQQQRQPQQAEQPQQAPPPPKPETKPLLTPVREEVPSASATPALAAKPTAQESSANAVASVAAPAIPSMPPAVPAKPSLPVLVAPKPKHAAPHIHYDSIASRQQHHHHQHSTKSGAAPAPPVPSASANPFRDSAAVPGFASSSPVAAQPLRGFDPAPNPFKQSKPRLVKPTPVRASSPASNPFRNGTPSAAQHGVFPPRLVVDTSAVAGGGADDGASSQASSSRSKRLDRLMGSPPLPPRPALNPPPLPPRHISPLIQAGLNASSEVRKAKQALPPKTFTVLQSSSSRHPVSEKPRLLNGQTAPPEVLPPPQHHAKRRSVSGSKAFAAAGTGGGTTTDGGGAGGAESRKAISDVQSVHRRGSGSTLEAGRATDGHRGSELSRFDGEGAAGGSIAAPVAVASNGKRIPPTVAPKPSYPYSKAGDADHGSSSIRAKSSLPNWLKEQEALQREALESGEEPPAPPPIQPTEGGVRARTVIDALDDEAEAMDGDNDGRPGSNLNPFLTRPRFRTQDPGSVAGRASQMDQQAAAAAAAAEGNAPGAGGGGSEGDGDTAEGTQRADNANSQPAWGHALESGTYAGFKPNREAANSGGLRLVPPSKQAKMQSSAAELAQEGIRPAEDLRSHYGHARGLSAGGGGERDHGDHQQYPHRSASPSGHSSSGGGVGGAGNDVLSPATPTTAGGPRDLYMRRQGSSHTANSIGSGLRDRVSEMLRLNDGPAKGQRPVDLLSQDIQALVQKHDWLARAAAGATGKPLREDRTRLMQDYRGHDGDEDEGGRRNGYDGIDDDDEGDNDAPTNDRPDGAWPTTLRRAGSLNPRRSASYSASASAGTAPFLSRRSAETSRAVPPNLPPAGLEGSRRWSSYVAGSPKASSQLQQHSAAAKGAFGGVPESALDDADEEGQGDDDEDEDGQEGGRKFAGSGDSGWKSSTSVAEIKAEHERQRQRQREGWEPL